MKFESGMCFSLSDLQAKLRTPEWRRLAPNVCLYQKKLLTTEERF